MAWRHCIAGLGAAGLFPGLRSYEVLWNWTGNVSTSTFQLLSAAYETQWNTGIVAGASATTGGGGAVPEPGEWAAMGILGAGLTGLVIRKRRRA